MLTPALVSEQLSGYFFSLLQKTGKQLQYLFQELSLIDGPKGLQSVGIEERARHQVCPDLNSLLQRQGLPTTVLLCIYCCGQPQ